MSTKTFAAIGAVVVVVIIGLVALIGGGEDEAQASETDGAFITGMVPHHESAIEMAEMAQEQAKHPEIKQLADDIVAAQTDEIEILGDIHERLFGEPVGQMSHGSLGLSEEMMGMDMDMSMLETARPFDREFIDMMFAHHQGAIRMAQIELAEGADDETKSLASAIIDAQSREITQLNEWRAQWYGSPSPAGGIPDSETTLEQMEEGERRHGGHGALAATRPGRAGPGTAPGPGVVPRRRRPTRCRPAFRPPLARRARLRRGSPCARSHARRLRRARPNRWCHGCRRRRGNPSSGP